MRAHDLILELGRNLVRKRDFYAGSLMILFGLVAVIKGPGYRIGTLMHMGPGFMPTALGVIMILLGIAIAATALGPSVRRHCRCRTHSALQACRRTGRSSREY